jgi:hypothetical protein
MVKTPRIKQRQEREFFAHHMLLHVAKLELDTAKASDVGHFNHCLVAMAFSAFAIEALANAIGSRTIDEWSDFESSSPMAKVRLLAERLNVPFDSQKAPWSTLRYLTKFRNALAHAKPEQILEERVMLEAEYEARKFRAPPSKMEREITLGNAQRCFDAVQQLKGLFTDALPVDKRFGIYADMWHGGVELANN